MEWGLEMNMEDDAGLGLAILCVQQALISVSEDNCPLKPVRTGKYSLKWTPNLESLRRALRLLFNKSWNERIPQSWELYRQAQRRYSKEVMKASKEA